VTIEVCDNGAGLKNQDEIEEGVGLSNTRARLHHLYCEDQSFELHQGPEGGLLARLTIPWHTEDEKHENTNLNRGRRAAGP
jgi:two-component system, LytTR family, sensor kinase